jgi:GxxExxY protein
VEFEGLHAEVTDHVIKVFYEVANELGHGFFESVYRKSMAIALKQTGLNVEEEVPVPVSFRGLPVGVFYADIVVENVLLLELKVAEEISKAMEAQMTHYLRSTPIEIGLVLGFGERAKFRRVIFTNDRKKSPRMARIKDG